MFWRSLGDDGVEWCGVTTNVFLHLLVPVHSVVVKVDLGVQAHNSAVVVLTQRIHLVVVRGAWLKTLFHVAVMVSPWFSPSGLTYFLCRIR